MDWIFVIEYDGICLVMFVMIWVSFGVLLVVDFVVFGDYFCCVWW